MTPLATILAGPCLIERCESAIAIEPLQFIPIPSGPARPDPLPVSHAGSGNQMPPPSPLERAARHRSDAVPPAGTTAQGDRGHSARWNGTEAGQTHRGVAFSHGAFVSPMEQRDHG